MTNESTSINMKKREPIFLKICGETYHIADVVLNFEEGNEAIYYVPIVKLLCLIVKLFFQQPCHL